MKTLIDNQMRTKLFLFLILIFVRLDLFSQMIQNEIIVPPNLTSNKLENCNIDKPNLYSGTVDDNIPIYEIRIKNFSLPITLNHNYNGFKPAESASWVGLGWNLRVGGGISRIINNRPDEDPSGYESISSMLNIPDPINNKAGFNSFSSNLTKEQLKSFAEGWWDGLPDEFILSANDINAKFIQLRNGNFATIPFKPIVISGSGFDQWIVQDESGNKYTFGKLTSNDTNGVEESYSETVINPDADQDMSLDAKTKYLLRTIQLNTGETIVFNYEPESVSYDSGRSETFYYPLSGNINSSNGDQGLPFQQYCSTTAMHTFCRLTSIETPYEKVYFKKGSLRKDLNSTNSYPLSEIEVQNSTGQTIKGCLFYSSYMGNTASYSSCRLMLDSIVEYGSTPSVHKPAYSFTYEQNSGIPAYNSKSIDHWGYYNGFNNSILIPKSLDNSNYNSYFTSGGNREPNHDYSKIGLLTMVKLPTRGSLNYQYEPNSYGYVNDSPVNEIIYDNVTYRANAIYKDDEITVNNSFTITKDQEVTIDYFLRYYRKVGSTIPMDETPPYVRITQNLSSNNNVYYWSSGNSETKSGTVSKVLTAGTYYLEGTAWAVNQVADISVTYTTPRKDSNGNLMYNKNKLTGGHRVSQLTKQDGSNGGNNITQVINYTCSSDSSRSSGVLVNVPNYEYNYTKMNVDNSSSIPVQLSDINYIARTGNSTRPLVSDDSHVNYCEVTSITNQNVKSISYFTSGISFPDISFPRNASNISKAYERGLLAKELQFNNLTRQVKSIQYNFNFSRTENKNGIGGVYLVEYQHKNITPALSTFKMPWCGVITSEWIPLESVTEQVDGVSTTNSYYYDNPVHAQITRTKVDNTEEKYTYTLYSYDYSNTGMGDFIGEMKNAHIINKPIEKVTYIKDKITGDLNVVDGEIYTYKTGSHTGQIESIYRLNTSSPIAISSFKFSNRTSIGQMPHVDNAYAAFSLSSIDTHYSTEPEQQVVSYDSYNNPQEFRNKDNTSTTYLWSYNHQYPIAEIKNATYADVKAALGYDNTQTESLAANVAPDVSSIRTTLTSYFKDKKALTTTYTYIPLIGMISATDPRGVTTNYTYDTFNRLYLARNDDKNIVGRYRYGYQNAPDNGQGGYESPSAEITLGAANCILNATGTANLGSVSGGSGNYTYSWVLKNSLGSILLNNTNTASTSFAFACSQIGLLTVQCTITDNITGLTTNKTQIVYCYIPATVGVSTSASWHLLNSMGSASVSTENGSRDFSYVWSLKNSSGGVLQTGTSSSFSYTCSQAGTLTVQCAVTDNVTGQSATDAKIITCYTLPTANVSTGASLYMLNGTGSASVSIGNGSGNFSYAWSLKNSSGTVLQSGTSSSFNFTASQAGTLTVQCVLTDNITGQTAVDNKTITCYTYPTATVNTGATWYMINATGAASVSPEGGSGSYSYSWVLKNSSNPNLASSTSGSTFSYTCPLYGMLTVQCTVTDNVTGQTATSARDITCHLYPGASVSVGATWYMLNGIGSASVNAGGGTGNFSYAWSLKNSGGTVLQTGNNASTFSYTCSQAGTLTIQCTVTDNVTGQTVTDSKTVACYYALTGGGVSIGSSYYMLNATGIANVFYSSNSGSVSYNWSLRNSLGTVLQTSTASSFSYTCSQAGTLTVQCIVTDNITGLSISPSQTVACYTYPTALVAIGASYYMLNETGSATVAAGNGSGNFSYAWSLKNSNGTVLQTATTSSFSYTCSQAGTLTIQCVVTDNATGQTATDSKTVACYNPLTASIITNSSSYKVSDNGTANLQISGGSGYFSYKWTLSNSAGTILQSSNSDTFTFNCSQVGTLTISCSITDIISNSNISPTKTITSIDPCAQCTGTKYKCINNNCEVGDKVYTSSSLISTKPMKYRCIYHYEWSDGSKSINYTETNSRECAL